MSTDNCIEFRNVNFAYGERLILHNLNLVIPHGKLVGVMGGSGSGKTTLLRLISGQNRPYSGDVLVAGKSVEKMSNVELYQHRRRMGMLFQFGALFTDLSVFDNVAFPIREHTELPNRMIRDLVTMKLEAVGLRGAEKLMPAELSGGMSRRVALARAIALDPHLILYDEPFAGLDPISLGVIAHLIQKFNSALGTTAVIVTHDVKKSLEIVDHVLFVSGGEVVAHGTPDQIRHSDSPWVQQFILGESDGPVHYTYPAERSLSQDLGLHRGFHA